jgi:hypothetical protein
MRCTTLPVWNVVVNNKEILSCGKCINQLAINGESVSEPISEDPILGSQCECPGCGKH